MKFADFAKKHFPLAHPRSIRRFAAKKRRKTLSGFQAGDRVQHLVAGSIATVLWVREYNIYVRFSDNSEGSFPSSAWVLVS